MPPAGVWGAPIPFLSGADGEEGLLRPPEQLDDTGEALDP
jgi:hypothetical protein